MPGSGQKSGGGSVGGSGPGSAMLISHGGNIKIQQQPANAHHVGVNSFKGYGMNQKLAKSECPTPKS